MTIKAFFKRIGRWLDRPRVRSTVFILLCIAAGGAAWWLHEHQIRVPSLPVQKIIGHLPPAPVPPAHVYARPRIAIVIDDVGMNEEETREAIALPPGVTLSFFPYAPNVQANVDAAKAAGHEILMHVPSEAVGGEDPGPGALRVNMNDDELRQTVERNLSSFHGYAGINNHMGSRFTADEHDMRILMQAVKDRGLIFLDSRTTVLTKGEIVAREMGVPATRRNVFLDNELDEKSIADQFHVLLKQADQQNMAVAIGHPHHITLEILGRLLPYSKDHYDLVPVSALVK